MARSIDITDEYKGFLRVWSLVDGEPRNIVDAIPLDHPFAARIKKMNARVKVLAGEAEVLEAAQRIRAPEAPVAPVAPVEPVLEVLDPTMNHAPKLADFATITNIDGDVVANPNQTADFNFAKDARAAKVAAFKATYDAAAIQYDLDVIAYDAAVTEHTADLAAFTAKTGDYAQPFTDYATAQTDIGNTPTSTVKLVMLRAGAPAKMVDGATADDPRVTNPDWTDWDNARKENDVLRLLSMNLKMLVDQEPPAGHRLRPFWSALAIATGNFLDEITGA